MAIGFEIPLWVRPVLAAPELLAVQSSIGLHSHGLDTLAANLAPGSLGPKSFNGHGRDSRGGNGRSGDGASELYAPVKQQTYWQAKRDAVIELTKPNITKMVVLTSGVGFVLAIFGSAANWWAIAVSAFGCILGTSLSASGANALNQWWERKRDRLMHRTATRPLPSLRLHSGTGFLVGMACSVFGVGVLLVLCGVAAAVVSASTILIYVLIYTPMKTRSPLATLVGAVPGALPPLIGWSAGSVLAGATGFAPLTQWGGWSLFALMFMWQIPHFLAIAWMYKDDYARGGHAVLPVFDPTGKATAWTVVIGAVLLIPTVLLPMFAMSDRLGFISGAVAGAVTLAFLVACTPMLRETTRATARRAFLGSILQLPVVLMAFVAEVVIRMVV